ncbi:glycosyltransferase family 4 protein [Candidatus Hydrogenedentota bacterium]
MKILVSTFGGDGGKSGIGQYIIHLLREFPRLAPDVQFDILMFEGEEELYIADPGRTKAIIVGKHLSNPMKNLLWQQFAMPRLCYREKYDLLFIPAGNRRMPFWAPCSSVGTFHDLAILHVPGKYDKIHTFYNRFILPVLARRLTKVITISEFSKRDLVDYVRVPEGRVEVIMLAADSNRYFPRDKMESGQRVAEHYGFRLPYILYISRIEHPGKNHIRLIRAFGRLKEEDNLPHQLVLAGSDWHGAEKVHEEAALCGASKDIIFTGFVDQEDIPLLYCGADAFAFPSLFEGFGLPILEAMASGVPVACSNASSLPEVAGNAAQMFDPKDEDSIEDALRQVLLNEATRSNLIARGHVQSGKFSWEKTATRTLNVFRKATEV